MIAPMSAYTCKNDHVCAYTPRHDHAYVCTYVRRDRVLCVHIRMVMGMIAPMCAHMHGHDRTCVCKRVSMITLLCAHKHGHDRASVCIYTRSLLCVQICVGLIALMCACMCEHIALICTCTCEHHRVMCTYKRGHDCAYVYMYVWQIALTCTYMITTGPARAQDLLCQ